MLKYSKITVCSPNFQNKNLLDKKKWGAKHKPRIIMTQV